MSTAAPEPRTRHGWLGWVGVTLVVAAALLSFQQADASWFVQRGDAGLEDGLVTGTGVTSGLARSVPTAALAAQLLVLVFGPRGRRLVGLATVLAGLVMVWVGVFTDAPDYANVPISGKGAAATPSRTGAAWAYAALGAGVLVGGLLLALRPGGGARAPRAGRKDDAWTVLDRGEDPTVG